jgi:hypothetical protein
MKEDGMKDSIMIDQARFADRQLELAGEFAQYVADHPEIDKILPEKSHIYFEVERDQEFNKKSLAHQRQLEGVPIILVRIKGLAPPPASRLIDPVIEPVSAIA